MTGYEDRQDISDVVVRFAIGYYDDSFVRTDDGWRIARLTFTQVRLTVSTG